MLPVMLVALGLGGSRADNPGSDTGRQRSFRVATLNLGINSSLPLLDGKYSSSILNETSLAIRQLGYPDVVALQGDGGLGQQLKEALMPHYGWVGSWRYLLGASDEDSFDWPWIRDFQLQGMSYSTTILSKHRIIERDDKGSGLTLWVSGVNTHVLVYNWHFPLHPYMMEWFDWGLREELENIRADPEHSEHTIEDEIWEWRDHYRVSLLSDTYTALYQKIQAIRTEALSVAGVILMGGFNEPSELDWTQRAFDSGLCPVPINRGLPMSTNIFRMGFRDAYRDVWKDECQDQGHTWPIDGSVRSDRIDMVYYIDNSGNFTVQNASTTASLTGESTTSTQQSWPSNHRAVSASFVINALEGYMDRTPFPTGQPTQTHEPTQSGTPTPRPTPKPSMPPSHEVGGELDEDKYHYRIIGNLTFSKARCNDARKQDLEHRFTDIFGYISSWLMAVTVNASCGVRQANIVDFKLSFKHHQDADYDALRVYNRINDNLFVPQPVERDYGKCAVSYVAIRQVAYTGLDTDDGHGGNGAGDGGDKTHHSRFAMSHDEMVGIIMAIAVSSVLIAVFLMLGCVMNVWLKRRRGRGQQMIQSHTSAGEFEMEDMLEDHDSHDSDIKRHHHHDLDDADRLDTAAIGGLLDADDFMASSESKHLI